MNLSNFNSRVDLRNPVRFCMLAFGLLAQLYLLSVNWNGVNLFMVFLSLWMLLPFVLFFVLAKRFGSPGLVLISALALLSMHAYFFYISFTSKSSTAALIFLFIPVYEFLALAILFVPRNRFFRVGLISFVTLTGLVLGYQAHLQRTVEYANTPEKLRAISKNPLAQKQSIQCALAKNFLTPPDVLDELSKSNDVYVRRDVGANPQISIASITQMVQAETSTKKNVALQGVAENVRTPTDILRVLGERTSLQEGANWEFYQAYILSRVACNPNTRVETLDKVSESQDYFVAFSLIRNPKSSCEILRKYLQHKNPFVAQAAQKRFNNECNV